MSETPRDPWARLERLTPARIALGRSGSSLPTRALLEFSLAHARARDAVHTQLDVPRLHERLQSIQPPIIEISSRARDRNTYLLRPDLGRSLDDDTRQRLIGVASSGFDLAIMLADGLSATAVETHGPALLEAFLPISRMLGLTLAPLVIAERARVALGDEVGALLKARAIAVLIGERPGLSVADSVGVYVTYAPRPGRTDAERNCISNVRPKGFAPEQAARSMAWLIEAAFNKGLTGVGLKDLSEDALMGASSQPSSLPGA
ncbi:MAG: ethanolamine ammonia-lyase subunit EutC [Proteobacteria bacterium]|nr:ethanolamine ammonia-lyase subunit EutC [Pseudomonadota bacterium]